LRTPLRIYVNFQWAEVGWTS